MAVFSFPVALGFCFKIQGLGFRDQSFKVGQKSGTSNGIGGRESKRDRDDCKTVYVDSTPGNL